jgi:hypothetical protein
MHLDFFEASEMQRTCALYHTVDLVYYSYVQISYVPTKKVQVQGFFAPAETLITPKLLTPMVAYMQPFFYKLCSSLTTFAMFVH